ncbi:MAG: hypothetical protein ACI4HN_02490 [Ruminococcus sp.]
MKFRNLQTKRKLKRENADLRHLVKHLETELKNVRTDLALERATSSGYRHENRELRNRLATLFDEPRACGRWHRRQGRL